MKKINMGWEYLLYGVLLLVRGSFLSWIAYGKNSLGLLLLFPAMVIGIVYFWGKGLKEL